MNEPIDVDLETVATEALRKLGRNIVNFSKIEAALKYLLTVGKFEGAVGAISEQLNKNYDKNRKKTLGKLVEEFHKYVLAEGHQVEPSSHSEFSISFQVTYDDPNFLKSQKRALLKIVAERNKLIHQDLALLDTSCIEDYYKLISLLDEQNLRLRAHLEELAWMIQEMGNTLKQLVESPEFLQVIQSK
jgi:hypothetical protein